MQRTRPRRWWRRLALAAAAVVAVAIAMHECVRWSGAAHVVLAGDAPRVDLLIVPGARIHANGQPYNVLVDRLRTASALFVAGCAPKILVSGKGGGAVDEDEVAAMRRWLEAAGVPPAAIVDDPLGLRTLDTMVRAKDVFGAHTAIVVSNPFHIDRCVFLGRAHGLDVVGVAAPYGHDYANSTMVRNIGREMGARVLAFLDVFVCGAAGG